MRSRLLSIGTMVLFILGFSGCFDNNTTDPGDSDTSGKLQSEKLTASADSVVSVMTASLGGGGTISGAKGYMATAAGLYSDAAEKDPSNSKANFGAALLGFELLLDNSDLSTIESTLESWNSTISDPMDPRSVLARFFLSGESTVHVGDAATGYDYTLTPDKAVGALVTLVQGSLSNPEAVALLQTTIDAVVIPRLNQSISYMENVLSDNSFSFTISLGDTTIEIDRGDAYLLSGAMYAMRGSLKILNAYRYSVPGATGLADYMNPNVILPLVRTQDLSDGPFLKLRNTSLLPAAKSDLLTAVDYAGRGIQSIKAETDDQSNDLVTPQVIADIESQVITGVSATDNPIPALSQATSMVGLLNALTSMLNGTFTINPGTGQSPVTVNLSAFLNNGIPDIKKVVPYHTWMDISTLPVAFTGSDVSSESTQIGSATQTVWWFDVFKTYMNSIGSYDSGNGFTGTFASDGTFTATGRVVWTLGGQSVESLSPGASILGNSAFTIDSQRRICISASAWAQLQAYVRVHPDLYFDRVFHGNMVNFSYANPFGVRGTDGVFRFAGNMKYTADGDMLYLSDRANSGVKVSTPVFPDPTFGGLLPGMTQQRFDAMFAAPPPV
jgi:hypothetical protein